MALAHPFRRPIHRPSRSAVPSSVPAAVSHPVTAVSHPVTAVSHPVTTSDRTAAGIPRALVVDDAGKPRRSVLLAAIMIKRGRSIPEIASATGLPADVVQTLCRTV